MISLSGVICVLAGVSLVSLSSLGLVTLARLRGVTANVLAFVIASYATIVLLAQILSEIHAVSWSGFLLGHLIIMLVVLPYNIKPLYTRLVSILTESRSNTKKKWTNLFYPNPALLLLFVCIVLAMTLGAYLILIVTPNGWDSLWYHLPRAAHWLQNGTLHHYQAPNPRQTVFAINGEIGLLWLMSLSGTDQLSGFVQWFATIFSMVSIYGIARQLKYPPPASMFAALIWSTLTIVVAQSISTQNDITVTFFVVASFYFLLAGLLDTDPKYMVNLAFGGLALGLAVGTKSIALIALPGFAITIVLLALVTSDKVLSKLIYAGVFCLSGFILVGSYNYILNWLEYGSIFGPAMVAEHSVQHFSLTLLKANLGRAGYDFFNPGGLPDPIVNFVQIWRPLVGQKIFSLLDISLNPPEANLEWAKFSFSDDGQLLPREDRGWYGPLGFLVFLPSLLFFLTVFPFIRRDTWKQDVGKWSTALVSSLYIISFLITMRWQTQMGRLLLIGVSLGAPLMAGFYMWTERHKWVDWVVVMIGITVLGWSSTHNYVKPFFGSTAVWNRDYYEMRTVQARDLVHFSRYLDSALPEDARLGLFVTGTDLWWDYIFWGPKLRRNVQYLGPVPKQIDKNIFDEAEVDYLILATKEPNIMASTVPLWPIGPGFELEWFLSKRSEAELFALPSYQKDKVYRENFGDDYIAYLEIEAFIKDQPQSFRALTTDPKMPYYDNQDNRFVFGIPNDINNLKGFTYLILAPWWSPQDYQRWGIALEDSQQFLTQEKFVKKIFQINGYVVYRILF